VTISPRLVDIQADSGGGKKNRH